MRCLWVICLLGMFWISAARASEDADPFLFGGDINFESLEAADLAVPETAAVTETTPEPAAEEAVLPTPASDMAPPPSDQVVLPLPAAAETDAAGEEKEPEEIKVNKNQPLTTNLKQGLSGESKPSLPVPKVEGTWVEKLTTANPLDLLPVGGKSAGGDKASAGSSLEELVQEAAQRKGLNGGRSNASVFDISGVMLRMSRKQVEETMQNRGFRKIMEKFEIPNFIKWRNEEVCRNSGVVGYERLQVCVADRSKKDKHHYMQTAKYSKFDTKEEITVTFTSNYTDNRVYKVQYKSMATNITGNSPKAVYLRNIKIYDFWKKVNQKYGQPDNKNDVTWGMGGNKPYLKAKTGYLLLEDPMFRELDYTRMSREDQRYMNTDMYSF